MPNLDHDAIRKAYPEAAIIDDDLLDEVLKDIAAAMLQADVNVRYVSELRSNVKKRVS